MSDERDEVTYEPVAHQHRVVGEAPAKPPVIEEDEDEEELVFDEDE